MSAYNSLVEVQDSENRQVLHRYIDAKKMYRENQTAGRKEPK
jgi:hypothetical protein